MSVREGVKTDHSREDQMQVETVAVVAWLPGHDPGLTVTTTCHVGDHLPASVQWHSDTSRYQRGDHLSL